MRILVDADACPVISIIEQVAAKYSVPIILLCDTNHELSSDYSKVLIVSAGSDAVDFALINLAMMIWVVVFFPPSWGLALPLWDQKMQLSLQSYTRAGASPTNFLFNLFYKLLGVR